jgi:hypothetical protein
MGTVKARDEAGKSIDHDAYQGGSGRYMVAT